MMTLADMPEMVEDWRTGALLRQDVYYLCLELIAENDVEAVLAQLPGELRADVARRLREAFDNATPAEEYLWIDSGAGDNPRKVAIIHNVRAWLSRTSREQ